MRGAPIGNKNAAKGKRWAAAIERALERRATKQERPTDVSDLIRGMDEAADIFVQELFEKKDLAYFKEFGDRMEGKSLQSAEVNVDHSGSIEHRGLPEIGSRVADLLQRGADSDSTALLPH